MYRQKVQSESIEPVNPEENDDLFLLDSSDDEIDSSDDDDNVGYDRMPSQFPVYFDTFEHTIQYLTDDEFHRLYEGCRLQQSEALHQLRLLSGAPLQFDELDVILSTVLENELLILLDYAYIERYTS